MLVFFVILIIISLISLVIYLSGIKIDLKNIEIERKNKITINNLKINIYFMLFNKIKIIKITIDKEKVAKIKASKLFKKLTEKNIDIDIKKTLQDLKAIQISTKSLNISAILGFDDAVIMAYATAVINILLASLFTKIMDNYKNYSYSIKPLQTERFYFKLSINCIISVKIANIINMIMNRSDEKNERTSDRRLNGNCYE